MTHALTFYDVLPAAWQMPLVAAAFAYLLLARTLEQGVFYADKVGYDRTHVLYRALGKHGVDLLADPAAYVAAAAAGLDVLLLAGLSMTLRVVVQGAGVNWGCGNAFIRPSEEGAYTLRWFGDDILDIPKISGYWRLLWTSAGLALVTWRAFVLA